METGYKENIIDRSNEGINLTIEKTENNFLSPQHPEIVSASRSTDIPAWYAEWFINRLREGFVIWKNPFNQKPQKVFFDKTRAIVFWSKNPRNLMKYLREIDTLKEVGNNIKIKKIGYYFQFTLNDYEYEKLEPNIPPLVERIATFRELSDTIGKEKVIWRFDPLILSDNLTVEILLKKIENVGDQIRDKTSKLVISFIDIKEYKGKITPRLHKLGHNYREFEPNEIKTIFKGLKDLQDKWKDSGWEIEIATCAEKLPDGINLSDYGFKANRCIDDELLTKLFPDDEELMKVLNRVRKNKKQQTEQQPLFDEPEASSNNKKSNPLKDRGQRKECGCIKSKDIGQYDTCMHLCVYCYANRFEEIVNDRYQLYSDNKKKGKYSPTIIPDSD